MKKIFLWFLLLLQIGIFPYQTSAQYNISLTKNYLVSKAESPWQTMALAAMGESSLSSQHLKNIQPSSAIEYAAPILALSALGIDARAYPDKDWIASLKTFFSDGQMGDPQTLNDDIFSILALVSAGEKIDDPTVIALKNNLLRNQNLDGGWGWSKGFGSDSDTTASALLALLASGHNSTNLEITHGLDYLKKNQNSDGGIAPDPKADWGKNSSISSTAWTAWVINRLGKDFSGWDKNGKNPRTFLELNQKLSGGFDDPENLFSPISAAYAAIALSGNYLPIKKQPTQTPPKVKIRIEGSSKTLCAAEIYAFTALQAAEEAAKVCDLTYTLTQTSFGSYLSKIDIDAGAGNGGWQYAVNWLSPQIGAADFQLKNNDSVLWYFGSFDLKFLRINFSRDESISSQKILILTEYLENGMWKPLPDTKVYFGDQIKNTNRQAVAEFTANPGHYKSFAEKSEFVRSESLTITTGSPEQTETSLLVNIALTNGTQTETRPENGQTETLAFTVEPGTLNFGSLTPGTDKTLDLQIKNSGFSPLNFSAIVNGDNIFRDHIRLDNLPWQKFSLLLPVTENKKITAKLNVPGNYFSSGQKTGKLIFWATAQ